MAVTAFTMTQVFEKTGRTLVVGLGETGLSVARYLSNQGVPVAIVDSRENPPGLERLRTELPADVGLFLGGFSKEAFERAEQIVISPGVSPNEPEVAQARARGVPIIGDIELFARTAQAPVAAVTGSNGKSTVVTLLSAMARRAGRDVRTGGNIGAPALDLLAQYEPDLYILELSSFQLETLHSLQPRVAVVLNVSADHMDRYPDLGAYAAAKQAVYRQAAVQVVNADDPVAAALAAGNRPQIRFTQSAPAEHEYGVLESAGTAWLACGQRRLLPVSGVRMAGRHNIANALAALALGEALGLPEAAMLDTLGEFQGLPHRLQSVAVRDGIHWYNDSKGTNVGATLAAIEGVEGRVVLIAGGDGKGADFSPLLPAMQHRGRGAVLMGRDAPALEALLSAAVPVARALDMTQAVRLAAEMAQPGDCVLLSPACAGTDMFRDYAERGERFIQAVREYLR
jgi:UDP-N-acetylmuramoylalanine--D-glutamate ligase